MDAAVIHGNCQTEAEEWMAQLAASYPNVNFKLSYFGPVIGTHLGEGAMGLGWTKKITFICKQSLQIIVGTVFCLDRRQC